MCISLHSAAKDLTFFFFGEEAGADGFIERCCCELKVAVDTLAKKAPKKGGSSVVRTGCTCLLKAHCLSGFVHDIYIYLYRYISVSYTHLTLPTRRTV